MASALKPRLIGLLVLAGATSVLTSCGQVSGAMNMLGAAMRTVTEPPESAPHALMRISTDGMTWVQPGSACESMANPLGGVAVSASQLYIGARGVTDQIRGVAGAAPKGLASGELRLTPSEASTVLYAITWRVGDWNYSCQVARSFVPVDGPHYQLLTSSDLQQRRCGLAVLQLTPVPALVETVAAPKCKAA